MALQLKAAANRLFNTAVNQAGALGADQMNIVLQGLRQTHSEDKIFQLFTMMMLKPEVGNTDISPNYYSTRGAIRETYNQLFEKQLESKDIDDLRTLLLLPATLFDPLLRHVYDDTNNSEIKDYLAIDLYNSVVSARDFAAGLSNFEAQYGDFRPAEIRDLVRLKSPTFAHYSTGERIAAGKTLYTPDGKLNISNFPRSVPDAAYALYALKYFYKPTRSKAEENLKAHVSAAAFQRMAQNRIVPNKSNEDYFYEVRAMIPEYAHMTNEDLHTIYGLGSAAQDPNTKPFANMIYSQIHSGRGSSGAFKHESGYEPPENIKNSYVRAHIEAPHIEAPVSAPRNSGKKTVRWNNGATRTNYILKAKGGSRRLSRRLTRHK